MKKKCSLLLYTLIVVTAILFVFPLNAFAQTGKNDSTFNVPDSGPQAVQKGTDYTIYRSALQPDHKKIVLTGSFTKYNGENSNGIIRIFPDGSIDPSFDTGAGFTGSGINALSIQSDNKVILAGTFTDFNGSPANRIVRLHENGSIDQTFSIGSGFDDDVRHIVLQQDGKILVTGNYTTYNGQPVKTLLRLNANGNIDTTFNAFDTTYTTVRRFALQPDGKILVAVEALEKIALLRLNTDGSKDISFTFNFDESHFPITEAITVQQDGKILIGGRQSVGNSPDFFFLFRVNTNGTKDTTFTPPVMNGESAIYSLSLQQDGKIITAGHHEKDGEEHTHVQYIARLNTNGTIDNTFLHTNNYYRGSHEVYSTIVFPNGKVLATGFFEELNTFSAACITLLNTDGTLDLQFNKTTGVNGTIRASAIQPDDKIIIGGLFSGVQFQSRNHIARLFANGELDTSFDPGKGTNGPVYAAAVQPDGKIIFGGNFTTYNTNAVQKIVRVNANGSFDGAYNVDINGTIYCLELQSDGKLLACGEFRYILKGKTYCNLVRFNTDRTIDESFKNDILVNPTSTENIVRTTHALSNGKILVGGNFTCESDTLAIRSHLVRLNSNGTLDASFKKESYAIHYHDLIVQPNKKIIACGGYKNSKNMSSGFLERYHADGSIDTTWQISFTGPGTPVFHSITQHPSEKIIMGGADGINIVDSIGIIDSLYIVQPMGPVYTTQNVANKKVIIGGRFNTYTGILRNNIARILGNDIPTGITNYDQAVFRIYPNPSTGFITADHLKPGSSIIIRNTAGAVIYDNPNVGASLYINVSNFAGGIYFISQTNKGETSTQRFAVTTK